MSLKTDFALERSEREGQPVSMRIAEWSFQRARARAATSGNPNPLFSSSRSAPAHTCRKYL